MSDINDEDFATDNMEVTENLFPDSDDFAEMEKLFNEGVDAAAKAEPVGAFTATIKSATLKKSQNSGNMMIEYVLLQQDNDIEMRVYHMFTPKASKITIQQLKNLGIVVGVGGFNKLPAQLLQLSGKCVKCRGKQSDQFYNVSFDGLAKTDITGDDTALDTDGLF